LHELIVINNINTNNMALQKTYIYTELS
jgi:hypothetical protein